MIEENDKTKKIENNDVEKILDLSHLDGAFVHVKVGNPDPNVSLSSLESDINQVEEQLKELSEEYNINCLFYVTHPFVEFNIVSKQVEVDHNEGS